MSEAEKKRRLDYKENRKKWLTIQSIVLIALAIIAVVSFIVYYNLNKTYYIEYSEHGGVDYKVSLIENEYYEEGWQSGDQAYVSSLIDDVLATFRYDLIMGDEVTFDYSYEIFSQLLILDKETGKAIYDPIEVISPKQSYKKTGNNIRIQSTAPIDYDKYNNIANEFIDIYELKYTECKLAVTLKVEVNSKCASFETSENSNVYEVTLNLPLTTAASNGTVTSSVPDSENKVLACGSLVGQVVFKAIAIIATILCILAGAFMAAFAHFTKNDDINYEIKIKKILSSYRSFIQVLTNHFDTEGYNILMLGTFNEMLNVRDTIQKPILMDEDEDKTCSHFFIVADEKTLYMHEIRVENISALYGDGTAVEEIVLPTEPEEEPIEVEPIEEKPAFRLSLTFGLGKFMGSSFTASIKRHIKKLPLTSKTDDEDETIE